MPGADHGRLRECTIFIGALLFKPRNNLEGDEMVGWLSTFITHTYRYQKSLHLHTNIVIILSFRFGIEDPSGRK